MPQSRTHKQKAKALEHLGAKGGTVFHARDDIGMVRVNVGPTPPEGVTVGVTLPQGLRIYAARTRRQR